MSNAAERARIESGSKTDIKPAGLETDFNEQRKLIQAYSKLFLLGYKVENPSLEKFLREHPRDHQLIDSTLVECKAELEKLKTVKICNFPKVTLYDLLLVNMDKMAKYSSNKRLLQLYEECKRDFEFDFPNFGIVLNCKLRSASERSKLVKSSTERMKLILKSF